MMKMLEWALRLTGLYQRGVENAKNLRCHEINLSFDNLPEAFEGFTILHLSDLHLDGMEGLEDRIISLISDKTFDLCVITGDFRTRLHGPFTTVMDKLKTLISEVRSAHGVIAVLGNHDGCHMVSAMEDMGIRVLVNENMVIERGDESLQLIGTDDVHYYYTDLALHSLEPARNHFTVALIHSPELYESAADAGVDLYLCGHTHAGQVCLPGGVAVFRHLHRGREFYRGIWRYKDMIGVTNSGAGTSGIPVRFYTQGEVGIIQLSKK